VNEEGEAAEGTSAVSRVNTLEEANQRLLGLAQNELQQQVQLMLSEDRSTNPLMVQNLNEKLASFSTSMVIKRVILVEALVICLE
jgi:hypothetical protein